MTRKSHIAKMKKDREILSWSEETVNQSRTCGGISARSRTQNGGMRSMTIRVGIMGYGNLGRGVECALKQNPDMELTAVFTRRDPGSVKILTEGVNVYPAKDAKDLADQVDVLILCGGSATDLPEQTPEYAKYFNVVDSFDTHAKIPEHFAAVDKAAREAGNTAVISAGWDPGMFSLNRL